MDQSTALQLAADEQDERELRHSDIEIIDYVPSDRKRGVLAPPGSVTVFLSTPDNPILKRIREAATTGQGDVELSEEIRRLYSGRKPMSYYGAFRLLQNSDVFATVRYGGKTLGANLFPPPGPDLLVLENPYNGGKLATDVLTLVEHRKPSAIEQGRSAELAAVALRHYPELSDLERDVLDQVPESQLEMNLAIRANCCDNWTDFAQVIIAVTFAMMCLEAPIYDQVSLSAKELEVLGPAASARALINVRKELLGHSH